MRPLALLIGIVFGSAVSVALGLAMTWIVLLFLPEEAAAFTGEQAPLLRAIALFSITAVAAGVSFYAQLLRLSWRLAAHVLLLAALGAAVYLYWPKS